MAQPQIALATPVVTAVCFLAEKGCTCVSIPQFARPTLHTVWQNSSHNTKLRATDSMSGRHEDPESTTNIALMK